LIVVFTVSYLSVYKAYAIIWMIVYNLCLSLSNSFGSTTTSELLSKCEVSLTTCSVCLHCLGVSHTSLPHYTVAVSIINQSILCVVCVYENSVRPRTALSFHSPATWTTNIFPWPDQTYFISLLSVEIYSSSKLMHVMYYYCYGGEINRLYTWSLTLNETSYSLSLYRPNVPVKYIKMTRPIVFSVTWPDGLPVISPYHIRQLSKSFISVCPRALTAVCFEHVKNSSH